MDNQYKKILGVKINAFFIALLLFYHPLVWAQNSTTDDAATNSSQSAKTKVAPKVKTSTTPKINDDAEKYDEANDPDLVAPADQKTSTKTSEADHAAAMSSTDSAAVTDIIQDTSQDPLQPFNRAMFTFNDKIDKFILKPVATFYNKIMPKPLNQGIHNVFSNLNTVTIIANDLLQVHFYQAANDTWRLGVNSTVGIGGIFDVATRIKLQSYHNDFGMTMARWGYKNSTYLVLPFFGPNTIRDGLGIPVDYFAFSVYPYIQPESTRYQIYGLGVLDKRAQLLKYEEVVDEAAVDRYVFVRDAYKQHRADQIEQNDRRSYSDLKTSSTAEATVTASGSDVTTTNTGDGAGSTTDTLMDPAPDAKIAKAVQVDPKIKAAVALAIETSARDPQKI